MRFVISTAKIDCIMKTTAVTRIVMFFRINSLFKINFISDAFFSHEINLTRKNNIA